MKKIHPTFIALVFACCLQSCQIFSDDTGPVIPEPEPEVLLPCNGDTALCHKGYDEVVYPTTHNSYSYVYGHTQWWAPNQEFPIYRQLNDGIRAVELDVYDNEGTRVVYQAFPEIGFEEFAKVCGELTDFLDENPREVVTLFINSSVDPDLLEADMNAAGLFGYVYQHDHTGNWPTLLELIDSGKRLVIFAEDEQTGDAENWYPYAWSRITQTNRSYFDAEDFDCELENSSGNELFRVNHWVSIPILGTANQAAAEEANAFSNLNTRALSCWQAEGHIPNFVVVDFYDTGDILAVADSLNHK